MKQGYVFLFFYCIQGQRFAVFCYYQEMYNLNSSIRKYTFQLFIFLFFKLIKRQLHCKTLNLGGQKMSIEPSLLRGTNTTPLIHVSYAKTYSKRFGPEAWSLTNREKVVTWCNHSSQNPTFNIVTLRNHDFYNFIFIAQYMMFYKFYKQQIQRHQKKIINHNYGTNQY